MYHFMFQKAAVNKLYKMRLYLFREDGLLEKVLVVDCVVCSIEWAGYRKW
jgi:hypothetical protein